MLATFFGRNLSMSDFSFSQVTSVEKRESQQHFSASASAYGLGLKKLCFDSLFSTSVTWEKLKSDKDKFFLRVASTIFKTKYYCEFVNFRDDLNKTEYSSDQPAGKYFEFLNSNGHHFDLDTDPGFAEAIVFCFENCACYSEEKFVLV